MVGPSSLLPLLFHYGVPLMALLVGLGELGVPTGVPAEIGLLLAGAYAVHSIPGLVLAIALVALADLIGTTALHLAVRSGGVRLLRRLHPPEPDKGPGTAERWRRRLGGHDAAAVFVVRLLPLMRMYIAIGSGLLRIRVRDFVLGAAPAAVIWAGTPVVAGYLFRTHVHGIAARYAAGSHLLILLMPAIGAAFAAALWVKRSPSRAGRVQRGSLALASAAALGLVVLVAIHGGFAGVWPEVREAQAGAAHLGIALTARPVSPF